MSSIDMINVVRTKVSYGVRNRLMSGDRTAHEMLQYMLAK